MIWSRIIRATSAFGSGSSGGGARGVGMVGVGSQYLMGFLNADKNAFDDGKTYKVTLPKGIAAAAFWSFTLYDVLSRLMLDTPQRFPRTGTQTYPSPAADSERRGFDDCLLRPDPAGGVNRGNWIQTLPGKGWFTILRLYNPLEPFFSKEWHPSKIELVR